MIFQISFIRNFIIVKDRGVVFMKKYRLYINFFNFLKGKDDFIEEDILTDDIYHSIGYIYCTSIYHIERISYMEIN